ncbi:MAG: FadR/GntR family transcriptional regulator [Brevirhabdus sp.]
MAFRKISAQKLADAVVMQIEELILQGILHPGEKLPPERELADKLGVSRPSLREAIAHLQDKGLLTARQGAGVFVADVLGSAFSPALIELISSHEQAIFDYVAFRRDMEGLAAERAARLGSDTDLKVIAEVFARMADPSPRGAAEESRLDMDFHMAIVEASHNVIMLHMMRSMFDLLSDGMVYTRNVLFKQRTRREVLLDQHRKINDAIQGRDPDGARQAMVDHLTFVEAAILEDQKARGNEDIATLRLKQLEQG